MHGGSTHPYVQQQRCIQVPRENRLEVGACCSSGGFTTCPSREGSQLVTPRSGSDPWRPQLPPSITPHPQADTPEHSPAVLISLGSEATLGLLAQLSAA